MTLPEALAALDRPCGCDDLHDCRTRRDPCGLRFERLAAVVKAAREQQARTTVDYRALFLSLCASLTLADHMGDVSNDIITAFKRASILLDDGDPENEDGGIRKALVKMGVCTLRGTPLGGDDEPPSEAVDVAPTLEADEPAMIKYEPSPRRWHPRIRGI